MTLTVRQHRQLKVAIGSQYTGPAFDRPALRQLPRGWVLDEARPAPRRLSPDGWVAVAAFLAFLVMAAQGLEWIQ